MAKRGKNLGQPSISHNYILFSMLTRSLSTASHVWYFLTMALGSSSPC